MTALPAAHPIGNPSGAAHGAARAAARQLLDRRAPNHSLEQPFYQDPELYALDLELIFRREWLFAGHTCEVKKAGDFFTMQVGHESVVIVRDNHGEIRAFFNVCRHRGSRVCTKERGNAPKLVCPYHQWTYNLDGSLLFAGHMPQGFDAKGYSLHPVHVRTVAGYIFVCLADEAPDFDAFADTIAPYVLPHGLENAKVAVEDNLIERGNWKLTMENNRECYHCAGGHPELLRTLSEYDDPTDPRIDPKFAQLMTTAAERWAGMGLPSASVQTDTWRVTRLPLIRGQESMTMDGKAACKKRMGTLAANDLGSVRLFHLPNTWNHLQADHCVTFRVLPVGPTETLVTTKWLVHEDAVEGVDYDPQAMAHVWRQTNKQDAHFVELTQKGVASSAYRPGPYSPSIEQGVIHFVDWYCNTMDRHLGDSPALAVAAE